MILETAGWAMVSIGFALVMTGIVLLFPVAQIAFPIHMSMLLGGVLLCSIGRGMVEP